MEEATLRNFVMRSLEEGEWLVLAEFGVRSYEGVKQVDAAAFKWKNDKEVQAIAFECKCEATARESFLASLGQAIEYQKFFPEVFIATQDGAFFSDQESVVKKLGLGYLMVNEKGELKRIIEPSNEKNSIFDIDLFNGQVRNRAIVLLTFSELFPNAYKERYYGGAKQAQLWIHNKRKGRVQYRAWAGMESAAYFGINIEAVDPIRNIAKNIDVDLLLEIFSKLPAEYSVVLWERATKETKDGYRILDRQKGSISIEGSIFEESELPACILTKEHIQKEIVERSKNLDYYSHLLIDKKIWDLNSDFTKPQYFELMIEAKETLEEIYSTFTKWST